MNINECFKKIDVLEKEYKSTGSDEKYQELNNLYLDLYQKLSPKEKKSDDGRILKMLENAYSFSSEKFEENNTKYLEDKATWTFQLGHHLLVKKIDINRGEKLFDQFMKICKENEQEFCEKITEKKYFVYRLLDGVGNIHADILEDADKAIEAYNLSLEILSMFDITQFEFWYSSCKTLDGKAKAYHNSENYSDAIRAYNQIESIIDSLDIEKVAEQNAYRPYLDIKYDVYHDKSFTYYCDDQTDKGDEYFNKCLDMLPEYIGLYHDKYGKYIATDVLDEMRRLIGIATRESPFEDKLDQLTKMYSLTKDFSKYPIENEVALLWQITSAAKSVVDHYIQPRKDIEDSFEAMPTPLCDNYMKSATEWFNKYIDAYNNLEAVVGLDPKFIRYVFPAEDCFRFGDYLVANGAYKEASEYYAKGTQLVDRYNKYDNYTPFDKEILHTISPAYKEVEGLHPVDADLLKESEYQSLPDAIKTTDRKWWLKPEKPGYTSKFVDVNGNIGECSTFEELGIRVVLTLQEEMKNCNLFDQITFDGNEWYVIGSHKLLSKSCITDSREYGRHINELQSFFPEINNIDKYAFSWFKGSYRCLKEEPGIIDGVVTIPNWVDSISSGLYRGNTEVKEVIIPGTVLDIGNSVFKDCPNLEKVSFKAGPNTESMRNGSGNFRNCPKLKEVHFDDFETFNRYSYDTFGPLENGSKLYIAGKQVHELIIPDTSSRMMANCIRNLVGAQEITDIRFEDGSKIITYKFDIRTKGCTGTEDGITKAIFTDDIFTKYPEARDNLKIKPIDNISDFISINYGSDARYCQYIVTTFEEFEKVVIESMHSIDPDRRSVD